MSKCRGVKEIKMIIQLAGAVLLELLEAQAAEKADMSKCRGVKEIKMII